MSEPTRDALHAETLAMLERRAAKSGDFENSSDLMAFRARQYAYAAECVRKRAELEAEVERLRARVEVLRGFATHKDWCLASARGVSDRHCNCELAAATREGTDNG